MSLTAGKQLLLTSAAGSGAYQVSRSLRFNAPDSAYLSRTPSVAGNRKTWTWAGWVKRSGLSTRQVMFSAGSDGTEFYFGGNNNDQLVFYYYNGSSFVANYQTTALYRDPSAWLHIVISVDTTQATASNRFKLYINGSQVTVFSTETQFSQNSESDINAATAHNVGRSTGTGSRYFDGYLADIHFIDGQALDPSSFTTTDPTTGQLIPKAYSGSGYGTNGFHLPFSDNSTAAALGTDTSGNGNNWTVNNISASALLYYVPYGWSGIDAYIPAGYTRTLNPFDCLVNNNTGVVVNWGTGSDGYFAITPTSSTVTIRWIVYDGSGSSNPTVTLHTTGAPSFPSAISPSSATGNGSTGSNSVGTYTGLTAGATYYVRAGMVGNGNPALITYITNATISSLGPNSGNDSLVDTPTSYGTDTSAGGEVRGNYATFSPLGNGSSAAPSSGLSNGNLQVSGAITGGFSGSIGIPAGKWYWEVTLETVAAPFVGVCNDSRNVASDPGTTLGNEFGFYINPTINYMDGSGNPWGTGSAANGDIIGIAVDASNLASIKLWLSKNNTWYSSGGGTSGNPAGGTNPIQTITDGKTLYPYCAIRGAAGSSTMHANFGQRPFAYTAPSGFKALCDTNLPSPLIAKPSTVMDVKLYTGNGSTQTISGLGFSPDFVWIKRRSAAASNVLGDVVRGITKSLYSNLTSQELDTETDGYISATTSDGFTVVPGASSANQTNASASTYVTWCWDAGSSTVTNTQGSITSSVRANASAGFSIVTYTGTGSAATVGHGLGVAPSLLIVKQRNAVRGWSVYHKDIGASYYLQLERTDAKGGPYSGLWNDTAPTSTVFSILNDGGSNANGGTYVAYCFAPVTGYSSFGSYTGNGSADGPFVYTGFRPRWVMVKVSSASGYDWLLFDSARDTYNAAQLNLRPDSSIAESSQSANLIDFLSNGFKLRGDSTGSVNPSQTLIYAAFAENPFQYARAR